MSLDTNALKSLIAVAETLSFSEAAARRNTVQSAISAHIGKLEQITGQTLFARGRGQKAKLTDEGRAMVIYATRILNLAEEAIEDLRKGSAQRTIRLGATVTVAQSILPPVLKKFVDRYPDTQIQISCARSVELYDMFEQSQIDIALMMDQGKHAERQFVESIPLRWVGGAEWIPPIEGSVPLVFLSEGPDLRRYALDALDHAGRQGHIAFGSPTPVGIRAFVEASLAATIMPAFAARPPLKVMGERDGLPNLRSVAYALYCKQTHEDVSELINLLRKAITSQC